MKVKRIAINYSPLKTSGGIRTVGSVPSVQVYQADKGEFTPDYTLTPLVLFPECMAVDPDVAGGGLVNANLVSTTLKWYEILNGVETEITSSNADYEVTRSGESAGQISVKKNASPTSPITLRFYAQYIDPRQSGQTFEFCYSVVIRAIDGTDADITLFTDCPSSMNYNPVRDEYLQTINASVILDDSVVTESEKCNVFWYKMDSSGVLTELTAGGVDNPEVLSISKGAIEIDKRFIPTSVTYVVKATYSAEGTPSETPLDNDPIKIMTIKRLVPAYEFDYSGVPTSVPVTTKNVYPKPLVRDTSGVIADPERNFWFDWYKALAGSSSYAHVARSTSPVIPMSDGMNIGLKVTDKGAYKHIVSDTVYITDNDKLIADQVSAD